MSAALLDVRKLSVRFGSGDVQVVAVDEVSFHVGRGERIGIVGESGAGKSVSALALLGLLPSKSVQVSGEAKFDGVDLLTLSSKQLRAVRGQRMAMVFQDPASSLNPRLTVGQHLSEAIRSHEPVSRRAAKSRAVELLRRVEIPDPGTRCDEYPHRLSGGMAQRVMIAIALACGPELIVADEPTTSLDVTIAAQIVDLLIELSREQGTSVVLITHDLPLLARFADRILVMYAGQIVEEAPASDLFGFARHPYTRGLLGAMIPLGTASSARLPTIPGTPPVPARRPSGCSFHPRCSFAVPRCAVDEPALVSVREVVDHRSACLLAADLPEHELARAPISDPGL